jgi:hypothetical protein
MSTETESETSVRHASVNERDRRPLVYLAAFGASTASALLISFAWSRVSRFEDTVGVTSVLPLSIILYIMALRLLRPTQRQCARD